MNITAGMDMSLGEFDEVGSTIREFARDNATVVVGTVLDPDMVDEIRVTVVATGLGTEETVTEPAPQPVGLQPVRVANGESMVEPVTGSPDDYVGLDVPAEVRKQAEVRKGYVDAATRQDMEYLDIPAFLRRQAD